MARETFNTAAALRELASLALQADSVRDLAGRAARWVVQAVPGSATAGVLLAWHDCAVVAVPADLLAHRMIAQQDDTDGIADPVAGPAREALIHGRVVASTDLAAEHRWADWPARALAAGVGAAYAYPLHAGHTSVGVLTVYAPIGGPFPPEVRAWAGQLACMLAVALTAAQRDYQDPGIVEHLRTALTNRPIIDRAVGILLARRGGHSEAALAALRRTSQRRNIPLRELAAKLVSEASFNDPRVRRPAVPPQRDAVSATERDQRSAVPVRRNRLR